MKLFNQQKKDILFSLLCIGKICAQSPHAVWFKRLLIWPITPLVNRRIRANTWHLANCRISQRGLLSPILFSGAGVLVAIGGVDPEPPLVCCEMRLYRVETGLESVILKQEGESCHVQHVATCACQDFCLHIAWLSKVELRKLRRLRHAVPPSRPFRFRIYSAWPKVWQRKAAHFRFGSLSKHVDQTCPCVNW